MNTKCIVSAFLVALLFLSLAGCGSIFDSSSISVGTVQSQNTQSLDNQNTQSNASTARTTGKVGMFLQNDSWKISLLSAKEFSSVGSGYTEEKPADGKVFLVLFFEVENLSENDDYFSSLFCEGYVDSYSVDEKSFFEDIDDFSTLSGNIAAGKKLRGYLAWEISKDWKEFEFIFKDTLLASIGSKFVFTVTPSDLTE